ncbi:MAG: hypothetical protein AAF244_02920 [Pseudomonadota bacterium]
MSINESTTATDSPDGIKEISPHLVLVPKAYGKLPVHIRKKADVRLLRSTPSGDGIYVTCKRSELNAEDLTALANHAPTKLPNKNKRVQRIIGKVFKVAANGRDLHIFDVGCGNYPILDRLKTRANLAFTGIDAVPHKMQITASTATLVSNVDRLTVPWETVVKNPNLVDGHLPVCSASYSLHYLNELMFFEQLHTVLAPKGLFIGNLVSEGRKELFEERLKSIKTALKQSQWAYSYTKDGRSNGFFIASQRDNRDMVKKATVALKAEI